MRRALKHLDNERGATMLFIALLLLALIGLMGIAVDVGLWLNTRSEAQRVADASALAGAGIYMYSEGDPARPANVVAGADSSARDFAGRNYVGRVGVDASVVGSTANHPSYCSTGTDLDVCVETDRQLVRVTVRGRTSSLFASFLGVNELPVTAVAAARVFDAGTATCVKPFAIPDMWNEATQDDNFNRVWDFDRGVESNDRNAPEPEVWSFDPGEGDVYDRDQYGYSTTYRNDHADYKGATYTADYGRRIPIKIQSQDVNVPSYWYPWVIPGSSNKGVAAVRENILGCVAQAQIGEQGEFDEESQDAVESKNGMSPQPIYDAFQELIAQDPDPYWDEETNSIVYPPGSTSPYAGSWESSPRVITIAVIDPASMAPGKQYMDFVTFARFFLEDPDREYQSINPGHKRHITGRFIGYVPGRSGPVTSNLVRVLQLVE